MPLPQKDDYQQNLETINFILEIFISNLKNYFSEEELKTPAMTLLFNKLSGGTGSFKNLKQRLFAIINNIRNIGRTVDEVNRTQAELNLDQNNCVYIDKYKIDKAIAQTWKLLLSDLNIPQNLAADNSPMAILFRTSLQDTLGLLQYSMNYNGLLLKFSVYALNIKQKVKELGLERSELTSQLEQVSNQAIEARNAYLNLFSRSLFSAKDSESIDSPADIYYIAIKNILNKMPNNNLNKNESIIQTQAYNAIIKIYQCITDTNNSCANEDPPLSTERSIELTNKINKFYEDGLTAQLNDIVIRHTRKNSTLAQKYLTFVPDRQNNGEVNYTYNDLIDNINHLISNHQYVALIKLLNKHEVFYPEIINLKFNINTMIKYWAEKYEFLPNNNIADQVMKASLMQLNIEAMRDLNEYKQKRESSIGYWLYDLWNRAKPENNHGKRKRISTADCIINALSAVTKPEDYFKVFEELNQKIYGDAPAGIMDKSSTLRTYLINLQEKIAHSLLKTGTSTEVKTKAVEVINNRFNKIIEDDLTTYKEKRGTEKWYSSLFNNGLIKTFKEFALGDRSVKDEKIRQADYFLKSIQNCNSAQDYTNVILDIAYTIQKIDNNSSGLKQRLLSYQEMIVQRFLIQKELPSFSNEEQAMICVALEYNIENHNLLSEKIKKNRSSDPEFVRIYNVHKKHQKKMFDGIEEKINMYQKTVKDKSHDNKIILYQDGFRNQLLQYFLAAKVICSGEVSGTPGQKGKIANALSSLAGIVNVKAASAAINAGAVVLQQIDNAEMAEQRNNMSDNFKSFTNLEQMIEQIVIEASRQYCSQIRKLHPMSVMSFAVACATRIIDFIKCGKLNPNWDDETKVAKCLEALSTHEINHGILPGMHKSLLLDDGKTTWPVHEILSTAIIDISDKSNPHYFASSFNDEIKCGFKVGTATEARNRNMVEVGGEPAFIHPAMSWDNTFKAKATAVVTVNKHDYDHLLKQNQLLETQVGQLKQVCSALTDVVENLTEQEPTSTGYTENRERIKGKILSIKPLLRSTLLPPPSHALPQNAERRSDDLVPPNQTIERIDHRV